MIEKISIPFITAGQVRAARGFLRWSAADLAERSGLGVATVQRAESGEGIPKMTKANLNALRRTLEAGGIEFIEPNGGGEGVRLK